MMSEESDERKLATTDEEVETFVYEKLLEDLDLYGVTEAQARGVAEETRRAFNGAMNKAFGGEAFDE
jgi:hypothetical protein